MNIISIELHLKNWIKFFITKFLKIDFEIFKSKRDFKKIVKINYKFIIIKILST